MDLARLESRLVGGTRGSDWSQLGQNNMADSLLACRVSGAQSEAKKATIGGEMVLAARRLGGPDEGRVSWSKCIRLASRFCTHASSRTVSGLVAAFLVQMTRHSTLIPGQIPSSELIGLPAQRMLLKAVFHVKQ
jgi:hypothetical protein